MHALEVFEILDRERNKQQKRQDCYSDPGNAHARPTSKIMMPILIPMVIKVVHNQLQLNLSYL